MLTDISKQIEMSNRITTESKKDVFDVQWACQILIGINWILPHTHKVSKMICNCRSYTN